MNIMSEQGEYGTLRLLHKAKEFIYAITKWIYLFRHKNRLDLAVPQHIALHYFNLPHIYVYSLLYELFCSV